LISSKGIFVFIAAFIFLIQPLPGVDTAGRAVLSGLLRDPQGQPVGGAEITLQHQEKSVSSASISDPFGRFSFEALERASYYLIAEKSGYVAAAVEIDLTVTESAVEVTMIPSSQLTIQERVMVVGDPSKLASIPGSAQYLGKLELEKVKGGFDDIHNILRRVPGVNLQEEEGFGLRPNVGMRGTGTERSSKITLMEDGVLVAPAPYSAPSAYYFPSPGRMEAIEVRKGSSQIKYGPRTQGGALNLVSTSVPDTLSLNGSLGGGEHGSLKLHLNAGDSYRNMGWMLETYQMGSDGFKELDGGGDTGFALQDYLGKIRFNSGPDTSIYQEFELKFGYTDQGSNSTYVGLTDEDFKNSPYRRYRGSAVDRFDGTHRQLQGRYFISPTDRFDLTATAYRNDFRRNWYKLQSVSGASISSIFDEIDAHSEELDIIRGADSSPGSMKVRANNRTYYSQGFQTVLGLRLGSGRSLNRMEFGFRYHTDQEDRFQHEDSYQMQLGSMVLNSPGAPGSQSNRLSDASAWALFIQDTVEWGKLSLTPGLRYEDISLTRTDFAKTDPDRTGPTEVRENHLSVLIPGIGASYRINETLDIFGGVHRGFSPPGPGSKEDTESEVGINYEAGFRLSKNPVKLDIAAFLSDYDNLLGADTLSSGGSGEGNLYNGGKARVSGIEASALFDLNHAVGSSIGMPLQLTYTLTHSEFRNSFESDYAPWGEVEIGDEFPYLPKHQLLAGFGLEQPFWSAQMEILYISSMRTVAGQGPILPLKSTDSQVAVNVTGSFTLEGISNDTRKISLYAGVRNLFDRAQIVARQPAGVRPGLARTIMGGVRFSFGR
jgi:Fe(3+) dicitrate transport protein